MFKPYPVLAPGYGSKEDSPSEFLSKLFSPNSRNVFIKNGIIYTRGGLIKQYATMFSGSIVHQQMFKKGTTGEWWLILFCLKDVYAYSPSSGSCSIITPKYATGTISVNNASATVTGSGTTWSTNVAAGDYIAFSSDYALTDTWYEVDSVDSDTQITLTAAYSGSNLSGNAYAVRKVFGTTTTWDSDTFSDDALGDVVVAANFGEDYPVYWDGSDQLVIMTTDAKCYAIKAFKDRVVLIRTIEGGATQQQRFKYSNVADCTTYDADDFIDITRTVGRCVTAIKYDDYLLLFKSDSKYLVRWVDDPDVVFDPEFINDIGTPSLHSVISTEKGILYFGSNSRFRGYNGTDSDITQPVWPTVNNISPGNWDLIYGFNVEYDRQARFFVPYGDTSVNNMCLVFQMEDEGNKWDIWEYEIASSIRSMSTFWNVTDYYVDDSPWDVTYVDEYDGYWDSREYLDSSPIIVYGGDDGYLRRADSGNDDDGEVYTPYFIAARLNFDELLRKKRLHKLENWFNSETGKSVTLAVAKGGSKTFEDIGTLDISDTTKDVVKVRKIVDKNADTFDIKYYGLPPWSLLGFVAWYKMRNTKYAN